MLAGACQLRHGGLVVLTSRFPFADLETFDGSTARMLEVPPFTPAEGSALLAAAGGDWLPDGERRDLVAAVDGHALAVSVLAGLLADHPPATDLAALRTELDTAARTDARVGKVLGFYAGRLAEPDRYLLAAVSLFARPVDAPAVLTVAAHKAFGDRLARTGRPGPAEALTRRNAEISRDEGWNESLARCDRVLGRLALAAGDTATAGTHLTTAAGCFRDGDYLTELADTLPDLAACAQATGDLDAADRHAAEAITIAAPRGLIPTQCAALAARARIRAAQATAAGTDPGLRFQGRDAADAAQRLAARHHLPWHELDALRAHEALDQAEGVDRGWAAKADALHARLVPPGLDPDPLATVERLVAAQKAAPQRGQR